MRVHDGPRGPFADDLLMRGRAQPARADVLQQAAELARAVCEGAQRVGRDENLSGQPGIFFVEPGRPHGGDAECGQVLRHDPGAVRWGCLHVSS